MTKTDDRVIVSKKALEKLEQDIGENLAKMDKIHKEMIAFSLFCMYCYSHDFTYLLEDYLIDLKIKGLKDLWELGKSKDKLQFFFNLAEKFYKVKFDK